MRKNNRIWRYLYKLHRYAGLLSAIVLLILAITGIALNHTDDLRLDSQMVQSPALLDWYGIKSPGTFVSFKTQHHWLTLVDQQLYVDKTLLAKNITQLIGSVETNDFIVVALENTLLLVSLQGDLIETIPFNEIEYLGIDKQDIVVKSKLQTSFSQDGLLSWQPYTKKEILWSKPSQLPLPPLISQKIKQQFRSSILPLERVLLDIHSGRFFGLVGVIIVDISGILLILLALSGCAIWLKHKVRTLKRRKK